MSTWKSTRKSHGSTKESLSLESLEERDVPAITILVNYSMDLLSNGGSGFFQENPGSKAVMNQVALEMGERISANLSSITPSGVNTWTATFFNPETGGMSDVVNLNVATNTIIVYVGAHAMGGGQVGYGATGGYSWSGYQDFASTVETRDWSGFAADGGGIWGGSIQFATNTNWYFGLNPNGLQSNQIDFYSVATHELGHVLGVGTSPQWMPHVKGNYFYGPHVDSVYGGPVPLNGNSDRGEWANGTTFNGKLASETPTIPYGTRVTWTLLDDAALEDVGWNLGASVSPPAAPPVSPPPVVTSPPVSPPPVSPPPVVTSPPVSPPPVPPPPVVTSPPVTSPPVSPPPVSPPTTTPVPVIVTATAAGTVTVVDVTYSNGASYSWEPFGSNFRGGASVALGNIEGNGIPDIVVASGPSGIAMSGTVKVYDGHTRDLVARYTPLGGFGGGLVAAVGDVNDDGHADIIVGVESGGWPVVAVINGATGSIMDEFVAYSTSYGGGIRVAAGDISGDGFADVVVGPGAGAHGLPVKVYSGASLMANAPQLIASLDPFPQYIGAQYVSVGNLTSDGYADILISTPTSGDQVTVYSGQSLLSSSDPAPLFTQKGWTGAYNGGIRASFVADSSGDGLEDIVITKSNGASTERLLNSDLTATGWLPATAEVFNPLPSIMAPLYIG